MPRISSRLKPLALCLLAYAGLAGAQQQTTPPSQEPPRLERIEPGSDVPATTLPPRGTQIREKKQGGEVTEVEVKSGKSRYTMKPNRPAGNAQPGDAQSSAIRAPQWEVLQFDLNRKKKENAATGAAGEPAEGPPPPNAAATTPAAAPVKK